MNDDQTVNPAEGTERKIVHGVIVAEDGAARCWWCMQTDAYRDYHDNEWGRPVDDDRRLFEKLCLEAFQAGLSWLTILNKRENFREAFDGFDASIVSAYDEDDIKRLLADRGIVRNRQKIEAVIHNAGQLPAIVDEFGSFSDFVWRYLPDPADRPSPITRATLSEHTKSSESKQLAKDLKKLGFKFVGPTTTYSFMQAVGIVNDHLEGCHVRREVEQERGAILNRR